MRCLKDNLPFWPRCKNVLPHIVMAVNKKSVMTKREIKMTAKKTNHVNTPAM